MPRVSRERRRPRWLVAAGLVHGLVAPLGCASAPEPSAAGDGRAPSAQQWLNGTSDRCRHAQECATGVCYRGVCAGLLATDGLWAHHALLRAAEQALSRDPSLRAPLLAGLEQAASDAGAPSAETSRAWDSLVRLGGDRERALAMEALPSLPPWAQARVRVALASVGAAPLDPALLERGTELTRLLTLRALDPKSEQAESVLVRLVSSEDEPNQLRLAAARGLAELGTEATFSALDAVIEAGTMPWLATVVQEAKAHR